jgi:hypothetical protein
MKKINIVCAKCGNIKSCGGIATIKIKQVYPLIRGKYKEIKLPVCHECILNYLTGENAVKNAIWQEKHGGYNIQCDERKTNKKK